MTKKEWVLVVVMYCAFLGTCIHTSRSSHEEPVLTQDIVQMCKATCHPSAVDTVTPDSCECINASKY